MTLTGELDLAINLTLMAFSVIGLCGVVAELACIVRNRRWNKRYGTR
jgi:hypothetical protein